MLLLQWLAFRDDGKYSAADYAKVVSEIISKNLAKGEQTSWNPFDQVQKLKRRRFFVIKLLNGAMKGLAYMHDHDRLHQSLGPASVVLKYVLVHIGMYPFVTFSFHGLRGKIRTIICSFIEQ